MSVNKPKVEVENTGEDRVGPEGEGQRIANALKLKPFDFNDMKIDALVATVGKRRFGKSVFNRYMAMVRKMYYPRVVVFTNTKKNQFWQRHVPDSKVMDGLDFDGVMAEVKQQYEVIEEIIAKGTAYDKVPFVLMIFEDVASETEMMRYSNEIKKMAFNGRHAWCSLWFLLQDIKGFNRDVRGNVDYLFMTYLNQHQVLETLQTEFCDYWSNKTVMKGLINKYCQNFGLICFAQPKAAYKPEDCIFYVEPVDPNPPPFQLGFPKYWAETHCVWEDQVKRCDNYENVAQRTPEEWLKLAEAQYARELEEIKTGRRSLDDGGPTLYTNNPAWSRDPIVRSQNNVGVLGDSYLKQSNKKIADLLPYRPGFPTGVQHNRADYLSFPDTTG